MFACLVIVTEIAILYTVFWYVFIRENKPYRVFGNPWGQYDNTNLPLSLTQANHFDPTLPIQQQPPDWIALNERLNNDCNHRNRVQFKHGVPGEKRVDLPRIPRNPAVTYGWESGEQPPEPPPTLPRLLLGFGKTIGAFCFR